MVETTRSGGCLCGAVRYTVRGEPFKTGLCHCADCRKVTGSSFLAFGQWRAPFFHFQGDIATFDGRSFCPKCGSRLFAADDTGAEIYLGSLDDAPNAITPQQEGWCRRREPWLPTIPGVPMYPADP